jgi:hypothetical protein
MAQTTAERQARYRRRRPDAGDNGDRRLDLWITTGAALALGRLARHQGVSQRDVLERLILAADKRVLDKLNDEEWSDYVRRPVTR